MLSIEEQKSLIEKFVRTNKNYKGNEDLFDDFCSEAVHKSYMVFSSISNEQKVESYISKVVHTSILKVLKDYGRVRRENNHYTAVKEIKIADFSNEPVSSPAEEEYKEEYREDYREEYKTEPKEEYKEEYREEYKPYSTPVSGSDVQKHLISSDFILQLPDPRESAEELLITKDTLQRIADSVCIIHKEVPAQMFLNIFYLRYIKGLKQAEIGKELGLSQAEVSKRLMRLSKLISNILDGGRR